MRTKKAIFVSQMALDVAVPEIVHADGQPVRWVMDVEGDWYWVLGTQGKYLIQDAVLVLEETHVPITYTACERSNDPLTARRLWTVVVNRDEQEI